MKMRFSEEILSRLKLVVSELKPMKFDKPIPKEYQKDPVEYARRMKRTAAVAVTLLNVENQASVLFTLRSKAVGTHAGQVSFPGGHVETNETFEDAALRELKEETNFEATSLCRYHPVRAITGTMVTPVFCMIEKELKPTEIMKSASVSDEVDEVFSIPVENLCQPETRSVENLRGWRMARFQVEGLNHPPIWGLTAFMLDGILRDVLSPVFNIKNYPKYV